VNIPNSRSLKELSKAVNAFVVNPVLPLPDHLTETIDAYLRRHQKYDDAAADRLHEDMLSIFDKHIRGNPNALGAWYSILRRLMPMIQTPERMLSWLNALKPVVNHNGYDKGRMTEGSALLSDFIKAASDCADESDDTTPNPIVGWLFATWMDKFYPCTVEGISGMEFTERLTREELLSYGKQHQQVRSLP
jgi:hypothetical protein